MSRRAASAAGESASESVTPATDARDSAGERLAIPRSLSASLVLVRHGESTFVAEGRFQGRLDVPLSALGVRQAQLVAERLADRHSGTPLPIPLGAPAGIWHSPLSRAAETARAIASAQAPAPPLHPAEGLTEIAQGEWEGVAATEVRRRWPAELERWRRAPTLHNAPGGERVGDAARRVRVALADVIATVARAEQARARRDEGAPAADGVGSADPVPGYPTELPEGRAPDPWAVIVAHDGIFRLALLSLLGVPDTRFWSFPFNLCAITVVALSQGVATLRAHNLSEHLAPLALEERAAAEARGDRRGAL